MTPAMTVLIFALSWVVTTLWIYVACIIVTRETELYLEYLLRLMGVALFVLLVLPVLRYGAIQIGILQLSTLVTFIGLIYATKIVLVSEIGGIDDWMEAIWVSFLTLLFIYLFEWLLNYTGLGWFIPSI